MSKGNVLVLGNSGVGKSTLINAVLGEDVAKTSWGTKGTTDHLEVYEPNDSKVPFRIIDSIGFEPNRRKERKAINAVKKWSKEYVKDNDTINIIWFCVEGTTRKLFPDTIKAMIRAASFWKTIPIIVVITKSYSVPERAENIEMVQKAFQSDKKNVDRLSDIIPVVAKEYKINDETLVAPDGITELITATNEAMPEGMKAAAADLAAFNLKRRRVMAQSIVSTATTMGATVGAVPVPFADAALLAPIEMLEITALAKIYGIKKNEKNNHLFQAMIEMGTVSAAAKALIGALKAIPGIKVAASVLNAVIAGTIIAALGEGATYVFEQIYLGNKTAQDIAWIKKVLENSLSYKKKAFKLLRDNINNYLIGEQIAQNKDYISELDLKDSKDTKDKKKENDIKQYNDWVDEAREKELPPAYQPLVINLDLLFALAGEINISEEQKAEIESMLDLVDGPLFYTTQLQNKFSFKEEYHFDGGCSCFDY